MGYVLCRAAQGKGVAREGAQAWIEWATANLAVDRLIAVIHPGNTASARLARRLGFTLDRREQARGMEVDIYQLDLSTLTLSVDQAAPTTSDGLEFG